MSFRLPCALSLALSICASTLANDGAVKRVWAGAVTERSAVVKVGLYPGAGFPRLNVGQRTLEPNAVSAHGVATFRLEELSPDTAYAYRVLVERHEPAPALR